jgi:hypothetical protein
VRVEFILLADRAESLGGKLYVMGGGFDRVGLAQIPGQASFDVAVSIQVGYNETNLPHPFELKCEDSDGNSVFASMQGAIEVGRPPGMAAGSEQRALLVLRGPFSFAAPGDYAWVALVDGEERNRTGFRIEQAQFLTTVPPPAQGR